ncbi:MAG: phage tail protein [Candidatus Angelobacter sp.]
MSARQDPFGSFNFLVEIDGTTIAGFTEISGLDAEVEVVEYREGADPNPRKLAGLQKYSNITLKRGVTGDLSLWNWMQSILSGKPDRRNMSIILRNEHQEPVARWNVLRAWPAKYQAPALSASANELGVESLELTHEGLVRAQ